jgi:hypothetical protein
MQHDLSDAVAWAVAKGIADPQRVCIMGTSYGGYATFAGARACACCVVVRAYVVRRVCLVSVLCRCGVCPVALRCVSTLASMYTATHMARCLTPQHAAGLAFTPQLYACGVSFSGMSNLASFVAAMPPW